MTAPAAIALPAAGTKIAITVTAEHIARGMPCHAGHCPIALAILDALPGIQRPDVWPSLELEDGAYALVQGGVSSALLRFGNDALAFIRHFDTQMGVEPAVFEAEVA